MPQFIEHSSGGVRVINGDCIDVMAALYLDGVRVDSVVCDPPYHLTSIVKRFGKADSAACKTDGKAADSMAGAYARASKGFMGKEWDGGDIAFQVRTWRLAFDLLKPGGHLVAFSGTRTYHRMAVAIEDAGFEIRDQLAWCYGTGFPKSHDVGEGLGTALKPAWEPFVLARKPCAEKSIAANVVKHGTGGLNIDACRIEYVDADDKAAAAAAAQRSCQSAPNIYGGLAGQTSKNDEVLERSVASIDAFLQKQDLGRWPANIVLDGSAEVVAAFDGFSKDVSRFFYSAKADADDRFGSKHPTIKPIDLMAWVVRLVTPPSGLVLDCFSGSGTTGMAAMREGRRAILIEREPEYFADIKARLAWAAGEGAHSGSAKARHKTTTPDALPLFGPKDAAE